MTSSTLSVRRATVEDLGKLRPLWNAANLAPVDLEPRLTEFQVVEDAETNIVGAAGFEIGGSQGRLYSEAFADSAAADAAREVLWKRLQTLATNHGVFRVWTKEKAPFWASLGFKSPDAETLKRVPDRWDPQAPGWLTLQLKNEAILDAAEKELTMFMTAQKKSSDRLVEQMKVWKTLILTVSLLLLAGMIAWAIYQVMRHPELLHPNR